MNSKRSAVAGMTQRERTAEEDLAMFIYEMGTKHGLTLRQCIGIMHSFCYQLLLADDEERTAPPREDAGEDAT